MDERFRLHPESRLLTPDAPGAAALVRALREGRGIVAGEGGVEAREAPFLWCRTSGSGGAPKVVHRRPASWIASFEVNAQLFGLGPADVVAALGALGHSLTLYAAIEALHLGCGLALLGGRHGRAQARAAAELGVTVIYATPSQLSLLVDGDPLPGVRLVLCGGGRLSPELRARLVERMPAAELRAFYGASETSFVTLTDDGTPEGAVGRPYPGVELSIDGGTGEVWVRSPYLFDGYEGAGSALTRSRDGWVTVGEVGRLDADGHLWLSGRRDRVVRVAERDVFLEDVEAALAGLTGRPAAAVALPDAARGAVIVGVVTGPAESDAIREGCRAVLPPQAVPRRVRVVDALPLLPAGKTDLAAIQRLVTE
ncbi:AMP-binding protein [Wenxinia marina]|uniref:Acyl-CoA synthetase (AMP-forming)/AMP-acid ligase II n=1 Tax=Wenxinia marina DSM 24838 TaxID=1123501 RepID=A0A0D0Q6F9_9RHOB|nr:AMP-binding protein [Wenxinia marina]KIQ70044.1 Acyl-CoA synthetase (AMP-forming)/AMP-acid ligase II [Wenxinia marina DSM 24838]